MTPSPADLGRLQKSLDSHRRRAEKLGIPAHDIRAKDLLSRAKTDADGRYLCYSMSTVLDFSTEAQGQPDKATIGHVFPLSAPAENHPGHTAGNVELECWASNSEQNNTRDTPEIAKGKRFAVDHDRPEQKSKWGKRKLVSRNEWPKGRKIANRGFGK
jgi:hypothetical protein